MKKHLTKFQKIIWLILFSLIPPMLLFMLSYFIFYYTSNLETTMKASIIAFLIGILIDIFRCKHWLRELYQIKNWVMSLIYIFYSICIFGFFMGAPIFNLLCGAFAGNYGKEKIAANKLNLEEKKLIIKKYTYFTTFTMLAVCIFSATIALNDPYTGDNLKGMFNLPFIVTKSMIWSLIIIGTILLPYLQHYITKKSFGEITE